MTASISHAVTGVERRPLSAVVFVRQPAKAEHKFLEDNLAE